MATMKLARIHGPNDVRLDDVATPTPGPRDVLVRVRACGICGSDLGYIANGGLAPGMTLAEPLAIGHEFAGVVEAIGAEVSGVAQGMRVAVNPDDGYIGGGGPEGAMAPYILIPNARIGATLYPIAPHVSDEKAALAEPLSVALHALNLAHVKAGDKVAVMGAGPIGLCTVAALRHRGCDNIAVLDKQDGRLARAKALGAETVTRVERDGDMTEALAAAHGETSRFYMRNVESDVFIDAAGAAPALAEAMNVAKYRARFAIIALYKKPAPLDLFKLMANELKIVGSCADDRKPEFAEALELIAAGEVDFAPMVSHRIDFSQFHEALAIAADAAQSAKVMLTFDEAHA
jgi:2-desacetyl-2-hydroxyethyl bacteriochlorophyllide A dehydrogenase